MRYLDCAIYSYSLPYHRPQTWSDMREEAAAYVMLRLRDRDGTVGLAEATVKPTWSGHTIGSMVSTLRELVVPLLERFDPAQPGATWRALGQIAEQPQARGLGETALWSLLAQQGPAARTRAPLRVQVSCTLTRQPPDLMAVEAQAFAQRYGISRFKLKGGQGMKIDARGVQAVREAVPGCVVQVDANSAYSPDELARYSALLHDVGAVLLEDPCPFDPLNFAARASLSALPLLVDQAARDDAMAGWYAAQGAAAISVKPGRYGAPQALRVAAAARARGAQVGLGLFGESDLGCALNLQLNAHWNAGETALPAELTAHLGLREHLLPGGMVPARGWLDVPTLRDIATKLDTHRMQHHAN